MAAQEVVTNDNRAKLSKWMLAAERRYGGDLRVQEITRALRALSSAYVERRERNARRQVHGALDTAGKRAAFALYYAPLHFIAVTEVVRALRAADSPSPSILDLGCGTGAAGAAWALALKSAPSLTAIDRHQWAVAEARWTIAQLGLKGQARQGDIGRLHGMRRGEDVIAAYTLNELSDAGRDRLVQQMCEHARLGSRVLILEPLARSIAPWWRATAERMTALGGRTDEWKLTVDVPPIVGLLGNAAGLNYRELRFRTIFLEQPARGGSSLEQTARRLKPPLYGTQ
jgi:SAM-dependent methyltransferase